MERISVKHQIVNYFETCKNSPVFVVSAFNVLADL